MGACVSDPFSPKEMQMILEHAYLFHALQLKKKEIYDLYRIFKVVDTDQSGNIELKELMDYLKIEKIRFRDRIFSIMDEDGSGKIDFKEFVVSLWNYCTLSGATLEMFAFDLYDSNCDGLLSLFELKNMLKDLFGGEIEANNIATLIVEDLAKLKKAITIEEFSHFARGHPNLLFPAFMLQHNIRQKVLGVNFWARASRRRIEFSKGRFISIDEFIELNVNRDHYHSQMHIAGESLDKIGESAKDLLGSTGLYFFRRRQAQDSFISDEEDEILSLEKKAMINKFSMDEAEVKNKQKRMKNRRENHLDKAFNYHIHSAAGVLSPRVPIPPIKTKILPHDTTPQKGSPTKAKQDPNHLTKAPQEKSEVNNFVESIHDSQHSTNSNSKHSGTPNAKHTTPKKSKQTGNKYGRRKSIDKDDLDKLQNIEDDETVLWNQENLDKLKVDIKNTYDLNDRRFTL